MRIVFAGTPDVAADVLRGMVQSGHEVCLVLTREDAPVGRSKTLTPSPVAVVAEELGLRTIKSNRPEKNVVDEIGSTGAELGIIVAYGSILKAPMLEAVPNGWYNLHFSLLPKYRGAAPVQRAILAGETETGVTMFKLDQGMDTGEVLKQVSTAISPRENARELLNRLGQLSISVLLEALPEIYSATFTLTPQSGEASFAPKPTREEGKIDFNLDALIIQHKVLALNPEPMAWCLVGVENIRIFDALQSLSSNVVDQMTGHEPGALAYLDGKLYVKCGGDSVLELITVQPSSKREMLAKDWFNGNRSVEKLS
jgi:methionyl-tRNA formyltransferase